MERYPPHGTRLMPVALQILGLPYALFLFAAVALYWTAPERARKAVLAVASLLFYASGSLLHAALILALALVVFFVGEALFSQQKKALFIAAVALCVGVLAYFKYARWALGQKSYLAVAVPLGISFFTFEFVHYLADVYTGKIDAKERRRLTDFLAFALFFPTLLAGPIKRYQQFQPAPRLTESAAAYGLFRMLAGLGKKVLIADSFASIAVRFATPDQVTPLGLWLAMYAYAVQIYFDFSGYSDLAIGAARLFGYTVPENFDWPYLATSISEFWRRWHISLSSWIRDYLFIPLGGSHVGFPKTVFNLLVVMAICGLWHGPAWHFVVWGLWHGVGLSATAVFRRSFRKLSLAAPSRPLRMVLRALTFHYICFGWVLFASPSLKLAGVAFARMLGFAR